MRWKRPNEQYVRQLIDLGKLAGVQLVNLSIQRVTILLARFAP